MIRFDYELQEDRSRQIGLIVLQSDQRIERDFRRLMPQEVALFVSRVPSGETVSPETLQRMEEDIPQAAGLLPVGLAFDAVGYGCTSGTAQIGAARVAELVQGRVRTGAVSDPFTALVAACHRLGITRLAVLSPYVATVSARLRDKLAEQGIATPVFGSFEEAEEARVVRIAPASLAAAARKLAAEGGVDGVFLSCTNLNTLDVIAPLEAELRLPVLSSNLVLAWHLSQLCGLSLRADPMCCLNRPLSAPT